MIRLLLMMVMLAQVIVPATARAAEGKLSVIRIGGAGSGGKASMIYLIGIVCARGLLEEEFKADGITIEWNPFRGAGPAVGEGIANGTLDFASYGDFPAVITRAGGIRTRFISPSYSRTNTYIAVKKDSPIKSVADLKGKKVSVGKGGNAHLAISMILADHGLTEKDVQLLNLAGADADAALTAGQIDAEVSGINAFKLRDLGIAKIIFSTKVEHDVWKSGGQLVVGEAFAQKYPDIVQRVINVYVKAAWWASQPENRDEVINILTRAGIPQEYYREDYEGVSFKKVYSPLFDPYVIDHYKTIVAFSKERGFIRKVFDVEEWIDRRYLEKALKANGLEDYWQSTDIHGNAAGEAGARALP